MKVLQCAQADNKYNIIGLWQHPRSLRSFLSWARTRRAHLKFLRHAVSFGLFCFVPILGEK